MSGPGGPLRIGIDVRYLSHGLVGGVHTYVTRLVPELFRAGGDCRFVVYADAKAPLELQPPPAVEVRTLPWRHARVVGVERPCAGGTMAGDGVDVAFFPTNYGYGPRGVASVVTLHDAINLLPLRHTLRVGRAQDDAAHQRDDGLPAPGHGARGATGDAARSRCRVTRAARSSTPARGRRPTSTSSITARRPGWR